MGVLIRKPLAALFIDASNFYHSLKKQNDLPFDAEQFASLAKELSNAFELKEIYFYDAVKDIGRDPLGYSKQQRFHERLRKELKNLEIRTRKLRYVTSISKEDAAKAARTVGLPQNTDDKIYLLLKQLGVIKLTREKGLDVLLITDMLQEHKKNKHECLIVLSGDSDYLPAIELMLSEGTKVVNLHTYLGSSAELRNVCSGHILMSVEDGKVKLKEYNKGKHT